ncbi:PoNe immunity protein domain-containing protein [Acinetobacter sp. BWR-L5]|uniref:PoNe immunity protein domain-containing protein n=1 Tax=Acinetobacter sp. BWR-L5 TaxID=2815725 RepID=UPI0031FEC5B3
MDCEQWFNQKRLAHENFRDNYLTELDYQESFDEFLNGIYAVTDGFQKYKTNAKSNKMMAACRRRIIDVLDLMSLQYSAGGDVAFIQELYPYLLNWTEEYAEIHSQYHQSPEADGRYVWHISLGTEDYWYIALRLICFGLLTGYADQMDRIMPIIDYVEATPEGQEKDGLIERLVAPFVADRGTPPDEARRHLPYRKLIKVFNASPEQRPALMLQYLEDWYEASRREPYYDQHPQPDIRSGVSYYGYWSWEAAAVTVISRIDDSSYRDKPYYPKDLVDYARIQYTSLDQQGNTMIKELR